MKIKELRKRASLTQQGLAEKVDLTRSAISQFETGDSKPSMDTLVKLSVALGVDLTELIGAEQFNQEPPVRNSDSEFRILGSYPMLEEETVEIPYVPYEAYGSFVSGCHEPTKGYGFEVRKVKRIPGKDYRNAVLIKIHGNSMAPRYPDSARYVVRSVSSGNWQYATGVHALALRNEMFIIKRITSNQDGVLLLSSDSTGATMSVMLGDINCMWKVGEADYMPEED